MSDEQGLESTPQDNSGAAEKESIQEPQGAEEVARAAGWQDKDEHIADGKDPEKWKDANTFNIRGEWLEEQKQQQKYMNERLASMEQQFNSRLENANKLHQSQLEMQKAELVRKRDEAIDNADREVANQYQNDIDTINTQSNQAATAPNSSADASIIDQFNRANPWVTGAGPKAAYAREQFGVYQRQGMNAQQSIDAMQQDINREYPQINSNRDKQPVTEGGSKPGRSKGKGKLTMSELTSEEKRFKKGMPGAWESDADFLQAVQDIRGAKQ